MKDEATILKAFFGVMEMFYLEKARHKMELKKPAMLVIDVQSYFFDKNSPAFLKGSERVLENIIHLLDDLESIRRFSKTIIPVIATIHKSGSEIMQRWWGNIVEEHWSELYVDEKYVDYKIEKNTYDAFYRTELDKILEKYGINQLIITGVMTHLCCETTARSGFVRGFDIVMVEDCLWDKDEWHHYASLKNLAHGFATISSSREILELIKNS